MVSPEAAASTADWIVEYGALAQPAGSVAPLLTMRALAGIGDRALAEPGLTTTRRPPNRVLTPATPIRRRPQVLVVLAFSCTDERKVPFRPILKSPPPASYGLAVQTSLPLPRKPRFRLRSHRVRGTALRPL